MLLAGVEQLDIVKDGFAPVFQQDLRVSALGRVMRRVCSSREEHEVFYQRKSVATDSC